MSSLTKLMSPWCSLQYTACLGQLVLLIDTGGWKRLCSSSKWASSDLCESIARLTKRLCTTLMDPSGVAPLIACPLAVLDKSPGIHPTDIGEMNLQIAQEDILSMVGSLQLCAGQESTCERCVQAMKCVFEDNDSEAILFVDVSPSAGSIEKCSHPMPYPGTSS